MNEIKIRPASVDDAPVIASIINSAWKKAYAGIVPQSYLDKLDRLPRERQLAEGLRHTASLRCYLLEADSIPVGTADLHPTRDQDLTNTAEFSFFYFLPEVWRLGYGKHLLQHLKSEARTQGFTHLCCWVLEENLRAISFYESQGMRRDGARQTVTIEIELQAVRYIIQL